MNSLRSLEQIKRSYVNLVRFPRYLWADLDECGSILDLGCGKGNLLKIGPRRNKIRYVGFDIFRPYLTKFARADSIDETSIDLIQGDASHVPFTGRSFAAVVAVELLEHLDKAVALRVLSEMERIARRKVVIIVPNGFLKQSAYEGNEFQTHRSSWSSDDLSRWGYGVRGIYGIRQLRGEMGLTKLRPHVFWELVSDFTQIVIRGHPRHASHLYAVKTLGQAP